MSYDCVIVPNFGGFMAHHVDARYDGRDNMFLPPLRTIGFNPQLNMNDSILAQSYAETYDISYPEALLRIEQEVAQIRKILENEGKFTFNGIGTIFFNEDGKYSFEPCEAGILSPDLYGLGGFDLQPLDALALTAPTPTENASDAEATAETVSINSSYDDGAEDEAKGDTEFIHIKKSILRNLAAACIAIIAFFALSTPLGIQTVQRSQIDTGMLTKIMPKEMTKATPAKEMKLNLEPQTDRSKDHAEDEQEAEEIGKAAPYYSIVLASRVTKRNAASYVEQLQAKGLGETKVLITHSNVKVIYGNYPTESEAYAALNKLRSNAIFADSWITEVKE